MSEQNLGNQGAQNQGAQGEKLFTQDDVNRIVGERLARAKGGQNEPSEKEQELTARENALFIKEQIANNNLPEDAAEVLKGLDKETTEKLIKFIAPIIGKSNEPIHKAIGSTKGDSAKNDAIREAMGLKG